MSKKDEVIRGLGQEVGIPDLYEKIVAIGEKRTEILDGVGIESKAAIMKNEGGVEFPVSCYAYVPDKNKVSSWKLPICDENLKITKKRLGNAAAAFSSGGFRGQRVELPKGDIEKVKAKLRSEYKKLGVKIEDVPEGIKSMDFETKLKEAVGECNTDGCEKVKEILSNEEGAEKSTDAMLRELSEAIAQIEDEDLKEILNSIISEYQKVESEDQAKQEEETEEEVMDEEVADEEKVDEYSKSLNIDTIVEELKLKELDEMLKAHQDSIQEQGEGIKNLIELVEGLATKNKELEAKVEAFESVLTELGEKSKEIESKTKELEKDDVTKLAEKEQRFTPFWGSKYQASRAAETVLSDTEEKKYTAPQVPDVIKSMSKRIIGGK